MPKPAIFLLYKNGEPSEVHRFPLPCMGESGFYRASVSFNSFRDREAHNLASSFQGGGELPFRCSVGNGSDLESVAELARHIIAQGSPEFFHENIWDAYEAVGYDYRRKCYGHPLGYVSKPAIAAGQR